MAPHDNIKQPPTHPPPLLAKTKLLQKSVYIKIIYFKPHHLGITQIRHYFYLRKPTTIETIDEM
jgi:hypothetical protein